MHDLERCPLCGKLTPTLYGQHIEGVLDDVPQAEQCCCTPRKAPAKAEKSAGELIERTGK